VIRGYFSSRGVNLQLETRRPCNGAIHCRVSGKGAYAFSTFSAWKPFALSIKPKPFLLLNHLTFPNSWLITQTPFQTNAAWGNVNVGHYTKTVWAVKLQGSSEIRAGRELARR